MGKLGKFVDAENVLLSALKKVNGLLSKTLEMDGWMDDLQFYILFNSISVISEWWTDGNERLCAMEARLRLRRFRLEWG